MTLPLSGQHRWPEIQTDFHSSQDQTSQHWAFSVHSSSREDTSEPRNFTSSSSTLFGISSSANRHRLQDAPSFHPCHRVAASTSLPPPAPPRYRESSWRRSHESPHCAVPERNEPRRRTSPGLEASPGPHHRMVREESQTRAPVSRSRQLTLVSILTGFFFSCLDAAIVATSMVSISEDLGEFENLHWVILAYLLSYMGENPPAAPSTFGHANLST